MIRIAYLISQYPAVSHTFILREVAALRERGITIFTSSINSAQHAQTAGKEEIIAEQQTFYIKKQGLLKAVAAVIIAFVFHPVNCIKALCAALYSAGSDLKKIGKFFAYFIEACLLGNWLVKKHVNHVHVHFANPAVHVARICKKIFNCTYSFTIHGPDPFFEVTEWGLKQKSEDALFIICISHFGKSQMLRCLPQILWHKIEIVPLGVDTEKYKASNKEFPKDNYRFLCVGRLTQTKGQHFLLKALKLLRNEKRKATLRIVGDGPDKESLQALAKSLQIEEIVTFTGALNQEETLMEYCKADFFVLPTFAEGLPVVLMEAMACGLPCISTFIAGIPELIRHQVDGLLVPAADETKLVEAMQSLIDSKEQCERFSLNARKHVALDYYLPANIDRLYNTFTKYL